MASTFNADAFLATETTHELDTRLIPVDRGWYRGSIEKVTGKQVTSQSTGESYIVAEVFWHVLGEEAQTKTGLDKPMAKQSIFVELTPNGNLDHSKGKNVSLGRLREALSQNKGGKPWNFNMLVGGSAWILVDPKPDDTDPLTIYNNVVRVSSEAPDDKKSEKVESTTPTSRRGAKR